MVVSVSTLRSELSSRLSSTAQALEATEASIAKMVVHPTGVPGAPSTRGTFQSRFQNRLGPQVHGEGPPGPGGDRVDRGGRGGGRGGFGRGGGGFGGRPMLRDRLGPKMNDDLDADSVPRGPVASLVVVDSKSREEAMAETEKKQNKQEVQRNRRMFGSLLGTLQKFRQDETRVKEREAKKKEIEKKIDEKTEREKEEARRKKQDLFSDKRKQQQELKILQLQMRRVEEFESWERSKRQEMHAIRTRSGPPFVYYLPKQHTEATLGLVEENMERVEAEIATSKARFEEELLKIEARINDPKKNLEDEEEEDEEEGTDVLKSVVVPTVRHDQPFKRIRNVSEKSDGLKRRSAGGDEDKTSEAKRPRPDSREESVEAKRPRSNSREESAETEVARQVTVKVEKEATSEVARTVRVKDEAAEEKRKEEARNKAKEETQRKSKKRSASSSSSSSSSSESSSSESDSESEDDKKKRSKKREEVKIKQEKP